MEKIIIAIAEDQRLFRESLNALISTEERFSIIVEEENGNLFIEKIKALDTLPHIALIDLNMPVLNGVELTKILHRDFPSIKVIILTIYMQDRLIAKMINSGACAYLSKNCNVDELFSALDIVSKNGLYMTSQVLKSIQSAASKVNNNFNRFDNTQTELTKREKEVLELICKEYSSSEIADKLYLSIRTVEGHRNNLLLKTQCRNTAGLILFAIKHNLFDLPFISI